ncbi:MAG: murein biosynthesis integral membrane protein MurJ [Coriobacteriia bacterium]|nr:murein biosynthesis integral membrane protein MurJ [Coriobacteriia bacterium]
MSISTAISRITGFVRSWAMAYALGVTIISSSYSVANNIPNMIFELMAGGVLSSVFIPLFIERMQRNGEDDAARFASYVFNIVVLLLGIVAVIGTVWAEPFVRTQTFRISAEKAELAVFFFRFFAIQIVFYGAGMVFTGVLNSYRKFLAPAVAPIFNNLVVIVTMLGFYVPFHDSNPELAKAGLAIGTTLGVLVMAFIQIPSLIKLGIRYTPRIDWHHPGLRKIVTKMGPTLVYVITNLIGVSFRNAYAFQASDTGPAVLQYAWMFYQLPYGIFAVALATAIFPELAEQAERADWSGFKTTFAMGFRATGVIIIPLATMLVALASPLITLYVFGRFTSADVPLVSEILVWWAAGLFFYAGYMYVLKTFYSMQDTKTPMITNALTTVLQVSLYAALTVGVGAWAGLGLKGIPIADGVFFVVHLTVLAFILRKRIGGYDFRGIAWSLGRVLAASVIGGAAAIGMMDITSALGGLRLGFIVQLILAGTVGLVIAYGLAWAMRVPEVNLVYSKITDRFTGRREAS